MIVILQSSYFREQVTLLMTWEVLKYTKPHWLYLYCIFGLFVSDEEEKIFIRPLACIIRILRSKMKPIESSEVTLKVVGSTMFVILITREMSFMLLENINSSGITQDDCHFSIVIVYSTGHTFDDMGGTKIYQPSWVILVLYIRPLR